MITRSEDIQLKKLLDKKKKRKSVIVGMPKILNIPRGWLHQSFSYLDKTQRMYRIIFETASFLFWTWSFKNLSGTSYSNFILWFFSAFFTHTLFWIFDSNWWAGIIFTFPSMKNPGEKASVEYLNQMAARLKHSKSITGVLLYGSISRGEWHDKSDIDMRLLRSAGFLNGFFSILLLYRERIIALFLQQPLDVYIADGIDFLKKMRKDEFPVILKKDDSRLDALYPNSKVVRIEKLSIP